MRRILVLLPLLAACAGPGAGLTRYEREQLLERERGLSMATQRVHDAATLAHVGGLLERLAPGRAPRLYVIEHAAPQAELIGGEVLLVRTGLLAAARSDDALAFVLAHELAHAALGHIAQRRTPAWDATAAEIAADAWARQRVAAVGLDPHAGPALLAALVDTLPEAARPLVRQRIAALRGAGG